MRYVNDRYRRTGTLRARMVSGPADYRWSSFACNALAMADPLIQPHSSYLSLSTNVAERRKAYRTLVEQAITAD